MSTIPSSNRSESEYVKDKHLRTEIVNNDTHAISMNQFNDELKNAIDLIHCKRGKAVSCKVWNESIGIELNSAVTIDHILCLLFITNYDYLRRKLMATLKKKDANESNEELIARHSQFHHLGRLAFELIHLFGADDNDADKVWFHGLDKQMIFRDTFLKFECMTSTTSKLHVALNYAYGANGNGMILKLKRVHCRYFDCRWSSDYSNEYESVFVQNEFKLHSIVNIAAGCFADYEWYLNILSIMKMMFNGMFLNDARLSLTHEIYCFVSKLVEHCDKITEDIQNTARKRHKSIFDKMQKEEKEEEEKWIEPYVAALFKRYLKDKSGLIINMWAMNIDEFAMRDHEDKTTTCFGYKLIRDLFLDQDWIYFDKLTRLYPSAELICIYSVDWVKGNNLVTIKLNEEFANKLMSFLSLDRSSLCDIWIYLPNEEDLQINQFIAKYEEMFAYIKWKPSMQQKQIPGLKEKLGDIKTLCITYQGQKNEDGDDDIDDNDGNDDDDDDDESDSY